MLAPVDVAATVTAALVDMSTSGRGMVADHIGAALSQAQGQGRLAAYTAAPATEWLAIEANDKAACAACRKADGTRFPTLAAALRDYPNGIQNASCAGGARCRGMLLPVWSQP